MLNRYNFGYHCKLCGRHWVGMGAYSQERKLDEDAEYLGKLESAYFGGNEGVNNDNVITRIWRKIGKYCRHLEGSRVAQILGNEQTASFEKIKTYRDIFVIVNNGNGTAREKLEYFWHYAGRGITSGVIEGLDVGNDQNRINIRGILVNDLQRLERQAEENQNNAPAQENNNGN